MSRKVPPYIKPAGWFKDTLAHLVDFGFIVIFAIIMFFTLGRPLIYEGTFHVSEAAAELDAYTLRSGFAYQNADGAFQAYAPTIQDEFDVYVSSANEVEGKIWHYFYDVVGKEDDFSFSKDDGFYTTAQKGSEEYSLDVGKWIYGTFFGILESGSGNSYFTIPAEAGFHYDKMPVLNEEMQTRFDNRELAAAHNVFYYLYDTSNANALYQRAIGHFNHQPYAKEKYNTQINGVFFSFYPSIIVSPFVFLFLIPMFSQKGKTLGKRFFGIMVISQDGYRARKWQMILRYAMLFLPYLALLIQYPMITLPLFTFYYVIDYMIMVLDKNHQGFRCKLSKTVVALDSSLVFQDEEAEMHYVETHPNSLIAKTRRFEGDLEESAIATQEAVFDSRDLERAEAARKKREAAREEENKEE